MVDALSCTVRNHTSNSFNTSKISCGVAAWQVSSCSRLPTLLEDVNQIVAERDVPCLYHYCRFGIELKARERIHRAMADARLLANPASRSRVADSDPN